MRFSSESAEAQRQRRLRKPIECLLNSARYRAKKMGVRFALIADDIKIPPVCPVLGIPLYQGTCAHDGSPTLDRIIPELGYVPGNVMVVSLRANRIKNNSTVEELIAVAEFYKKLLNPIDIQICST
jgi:hypothetical protein